MDAQTALQTLADTVSCHLMEQGRKSVRGTVCAYAGLDGLACAVGCLMDREQARMADKRHAIVQVRARPDAVTYMRPEYQACVAAGGHVARALLDHAQYTHDSTPPSVWLKRLVKLYREYGLDESALVQYG